MEIDIYLDQTQSDSPPRSARDLVWNMIVDIHFFTKRWLPALRVEMISVPYTVPAEGGIRCRTMFA